MKSKVYFIGISGCADTAAVKARLARLLDESKALDFIKPSFKVAVKMHFGEEGNTGFVKPEYARVICGEIVKKQADCILTDTNTLYKGRRLNSEDHLKIALEHGFSGEAAGAPVVIAADSEPGLASDVMVNQKFVKTAKIAPLFKRMDALVAVSHFKGHLMSGFGGALKNIGMGCANREGKLDQHSDLAPSIKPLKCEGCGKCIDVCPAQAVFLEGGFPPEAEGGVMKARIIPEKCIGCAACIAVCPHYAIDIKWEAGAGNIQEKMVEYAKAAILGKEKRSAFINFAMKITKECDCLAKDDPKIAPDIGIFASLDPVSIDKACVDLVNAACGRDIFKEAHPERDWTKQLHHAYEIGLGNLDYELIKI